MKKTFFRLGFYSLCLLVFLVPLSFAVFFPDISIFELDKLWVLRLLSFVSFFFLILSGRSLSFNKKHLSPVLFVLVALVVSIFSFNPQLSFFGSYSRQIGFFSQLSFLLLFFLTLAYSSYPKFREKLIFSLFLSAVLVSAYGILQFVGIDVYQWSEPAFLTGRISSTLGQPNYIGSFLVLTIFSGAYLLYLTRQKKWYRVWYFLGILAQIIALFLTKSRGAWIAFLFALFSFPLFYYRRLNRKIIFIFLGSLILFFIFIFSAPVIRNRALSVIDFSRGSVALRFQIFRTVSANFSDKPLLGWGLNVGQEFFARHYNPEGALFSRVNSLNDKAHNFIFDLFLEGGVLWLLAGLYFIWKIFSLAWKIDQPIRPFLSTALGAYLISLLFGFEFISGAMVFWFLTALVFSFSPEKTFSFNRWGNYFILALFLSLALLSFRDKYNDSSAFQMKQALEKEDYLQVGRYYPRANFARWDFSYYDQMINEAFFAKESHDSKEILFPLWARQKRLLGGQDLYDRLSLARLFLITEQVEKSLEGFSVLTKEFPFWPLVWEYSSLAEIKAGNYGLALDYISRAESLLPPEDDYRLNQEHRQSLLAYKGRLASLRGDVYYFQENYPQALENYLLSLEYYQDLALYKKIADIYFLSGEVESAKIYLLQGLVLDKDNYRWPLALAWFFQSLGQIEEAEKFFLRAEEIKLK